MGLTASCLPKQPAPAVDFESDPEQIRRRKIAEEIQRKWGGGEGVSIQYGGSVTYDNLSDPDKLVVQTAAFMSIKRKHKMQNDVAMDAVIREVVQRQAASKK